MNNSDLIYLDEQATTAVDPEVLTAMLPFYRWEFGNAASVHPDAGSRAAAAVDQARKQVARLINAQHYDIVFTSGATEANNLALVGYARANQARGRHLVTTQIEHVSVLDVFRYLETQGFTVTYVSPSSNGLVSPESIASALTPQTILVSVMAVNNEVGTIQPVAEIGAIVRRHQIAFHCDAAQALGKIPVDIIQAGIDLLTLSAHKMYAAKGVGALVLRPGTQVDPLFFGGGQEQGLRPGTLNVPGIVGLGKAAELAGGRQVADAVRVAELRNRLESLLLSQLPETELNGDRDQRIPGNLNISFAGVDAQALLVALPQIAASVGAACAAAERKQSHVLKAMQLTERRRRGAVRFGLGRNTTAAEIDEAARLIVDAVRRLRGMSPVWQLDHPDSANEGRGGYELHSYSSALRGA